MPTPFNMAAAAAILKTLYPQKEITKAFYKNNPLYAMMPKSSDFFGNNQQLAIRYALTGGRSQNFTNAQANKAGSKLGAFTVTRVHDYSLASIDGETLRATANDKGALISALENETESCLAALTRNLAVMMYRSGTGSRGAISAGSAVGTPTITLANIQDITNFEVGNVLTASQTDGGALRNAGATITITGVDRDLGQLTAAGNWSAAIAAVAAGDFLYQQGDEAAAGANKMLSGLAAWVPPTAPTATLFFGLDRTADKTRLGGLRYTGGGAPMEETVQTVISRAAREGADTTHMFINTADYLNLALGLGSKVIYDQNTTDIPDVGFTSIRVASPGASGFTKIFGDPNCPKGTGFGLQMDTWKFWSLGDVGFLMDDDQRILRENAADSYEMRMGWYGQTTCVWPGANITFTF